MVSPSVELLTELVSNSKVSKIIGEVEESNFNDGCKRYGSSWLVVLISCWEELGSVVLTVSGIVDWM